jgi:hypothetical protein
MDQEQLQDMGPIDYIVIEWSSGGPTGEAVPAILDLVDRGIIRVLDIAPRSLPSSRARPPA